MQLYDRWGAQGKCNQLAANYPDIFAYQRDKAIFNLQAGFETKTIVSSNSVLDLNTVLKASQIIAGEIKLDDLLSRLIYIIIENSGAQYGVLILNKANRLYIAAEEFGSRPD
ncbi:MAG: hypothetical protein IPO92_11310 [Saprospiraceae bacterium]|nr:hypothetical protein [Saprospiraceae bacterium]